MANYMIIKQLVTDLAQFQAGSWIQWWALPALQRSQNETQAQNEAKADVDHETLTYLAKLQDEQMAELKGISEILRNLNDRHRTPATQ